MWEFIKDSQEQFDEAVTMNDGDQNELPENVTELNAEVFGF